MHDTHAILCFGKTLPGFDPLTVRRAIQHSFKCSEAEMNEMFSGTEVRLREALSADEAELWRQQLNSLGLKVMIDQVLSHTSDQHPWFVESRASRDNPKADWYVWADARDDGTPPNNWLSIFGGSAWQWDTRRCQYYLHNFLTSQPDLNFHNPDVQQAVLDDVRFWLELGVDGYRLDTANFYFHDRQ